MERLLDVVEGDRLADEAVEGESALQVQADQHREVTAGQAVAVPAALQLTATAEHLDERQFEHHVGAWHSDEHDRAREVAGLEGLLEHGRMADGVDTHVGAVAAGDALDVLDRIGGAGVAGVGGPELLRPFELAVVEVDGDDRGGASQQRTGDGGIAHPTATEHGNRIAPTDAAGVDRRADAGHDATTQQARCCCGSRRVDLGALARGHQRLVGERADTERRRQHRAVDERHLLRGVERGEAVLRIALEAATTRAAHRTPVEHHVVAGGDTRDALTDRLDDAGCLVAEEERELVVDAALAIVEIGVADAARLDLHHRLTRARVGDHDRLDRHRLALATGHHSTNLLRHDCSSWDELARTRALGPNRISRHRNTASPLSRHRTKGGDVCFRR